MARKQKSRKKPPRYGALSLEWMRRRGYRADISERKLPRTASKAAIAARKKVPGMVVKDLFGFADLMAFRFDQPGTVAVQYTSLSNLNGRIQKTLMLDAAHEFVAARNRIIFLGWHKERGRWVATTWELKR